MNTRPRSLDLEKVIADPSVNARWVMCGETVARYKAALADGDELPPVDAFTDGDGRYYLADGFHRRDAHEEHGRKTIAAIIHHTAAGKAQREATLYASGANARHGLPRSRHDKRRAVVRLLCDPEWGQKPDRWIAKATNTSHTFVAKLRHEILESGNVTTPAEVHEAPATPSQQVESGNVATLAEVHEAPATPPQQVESGNVATLADEHSLDAAGHPAPRTAPDPEAAGSSVPPAASRTRTTQKPPGGTCPDGRAHQFDDEACTHCHEPAAATVTTGGPVDCTHEPPPQDLRECPLCGGAGAIDLEQFSKIPAALATSSRFKAAWAHWLLYRKNRRLSRQPDTMASQLAMLADLGPLKAVDSINASIRNGYAGLFPPKNGSDYDPAKINRGKSHPADAARDAVPF